MVPIASAIIGEFYLTTREAAAVVKRNYRTLEGWRTRRLGPQFVQMAGRGVLYRRTDLDRWLTSQIVDPSAQPSAPPRRKRSAS